MNEMSPITGAQPLQGWFPEIEQEVLGALMTGAADIGPALAELEEKYFIEPMHAILFGAIRTAHDRYNSTKAHIVRPMIDADTAATFLARNGSTIDTYIARLVAESVYGAPGLLKTARAVIEQWARVMVGHEAARLVDAASNPASIPADMVSSAGAAFDDILNEVRRGARGKRTRISIGEAARNAMTTAAAGGPAQGIPWGFTDLDRITGGIMRRDLTLIGARPSIGKTTFALSAGLHAAKNHHGVGFVSLEMDADKLAARAASDLAHQWNVRVPYQDMIRGRVDAEKFEALQSATRDMDAIPLWIEEKPGLAMSDIRVKLDAMMGEAERAGFPLEILFVDHLGLIRPSDAYRDNRANQIAEMTGGMKSLAREYGIAVVLLSQLNRALESRDNKRPSMADLRDSGAIEQDADTILFLYREAYYLEREKGGGAEREAERLSRLIDCQHNMEVAVAKQRNGPIATVDLYVEMAFSAVRNAARTGYGGRGGA
jgi:replicative DNA helicase